MHKHDLKDVIHTKVMPSAECHTNHPLVHCKLRLHFKPKPRKWSPPKEKLNLNKLQSAEVKADFQAGLLSKFENSDCRENTSPETLWDQLKRAILQTSEEVLGFTTKKNKDWFNKNKQKIQELLAKKRSSHQAHLAQPCPVRRAVSFATSSSTNFERVVDQSCKVNSAIHRPRWLQRLLQSLQGSMVQLTGSRVPCAVQMSKCFLQTRPPFWVIGLSTSNPSLVMTVLSWTQQFSASPSNHSKQNWMNYPLWKKLPKP